MKPKYTHQWNLTEKEAIMLQKELADKVIKKDTFNTIKNIAGVDVAYEKNGKKLVAAVVILNSETLEIVDSAITEDIERFPYIPGLFSFREIPPLIKAFKKIKIVPDLIVCDGQGIAHPRRFGLACHLGLLFDIPTIGCGKTRFIGNADEPEPPRGSITPLVEKSEIIGNVLRTQNNIKPVYVSIGHKISLDSASDWILKLTPKYRLPETTRQADQLVKKEMKI